MENEKIYEKLENIERMLQFSKKVLTFDEAVLFCGTSPSYMYKLTSTRQIPFYKPTGKKIYFNREELEEWLLRNRTKTEEEIDKEASNYILNKKRY